MRRKSIIDKTRKAYGIDVHGNICLLGDTVANALKENMMVTEYEKRLIELNPHLKIEIRVEDK